jgi:CheY-like chemotaxis protein
VSRIVTGKLRLELRKVDPAAVVRAAVDVVRPAAESKRIVIGVSIDPAVGTIAADPSRLQQVVWNLLANAVKFSPKGSHIQVLLSALPSAPDRHAGDALVVREPTPHDAYAPRGVAAGLRLQVIDAGAGIDPEFLPHVFERFRQAEGKHQRSGGGLGLGLAIVKHLVELHEGTITAHSEGIGRGATFTVTLPDRSRILGMLGAPWSSDPTTPMTRRLIGVRVVIVDDEPDARELVATILRGQGASVTVAASAHEALTAVRYERPDVFVSDIGMPDEDGFMLLKKVRSVTAEGRPVPALALTAYASADDAKMAAVAGFQRHLPKPVAPAALVDAVATLAGRIT